MTSVPRFRRKGRKDRNLTKTEHSYILDQKRLAVALVRYETEKAGLSHKQAERLLERMTREAWAGGDYVTGWAGRVE